MTTQPEQPSENNSPPVVILVTPQLGENIGMAARAMLNCGLSELRLVSPRDDWPSEKALAASAKAARVIEKTRLYETTEAAVADLHHVYAATVRPRTMTKRVITPRQAAPEYVEASQKFETSGVMFGPEAMGLSNDDIALADTVLTAPVNPECPSLNLAQAVFMVGYEWYQHLDQTPQEFVAIPKETTLATKKDLGGLFVHMETELEACGFLRVEERRSILIRNIRNVFQRAGMTEQEVRTFRGIIKHLVRGKPS